MRTAISALLLAVLVHSQNHLQAGIPLASYECTNYAAFYGTLYSPSTDPAHKQYQALALSAYLTLKSLSWHVYHRDQSSTCHMDNCHIYRLYDIYVQ